jgi:hypothetical protein
VFRMIVGSPLRSEFFAGRHHSRMLITVAEIVPMIEPIILSMRYRP